MLDNIDADRVEFVTDQLENNEATGREDQTEEDVILFFSVLLLGVVLLRNMLGEIRGVHSGDILR